MATPPTANVVRVRWTGTNGTATWGCRIYIAYNPLVLPDSSDVNAIATHTSVAWDSNLAALHGPALHLTAVTVEDLSGPSGAVGTWSGSIAGSRGGSPSLPDDVAANVSFKIPARYRGGHPKTFLPVGLSDDLDTNGTWTSGFVTAVNTGISGFVAGVLSTTGLSCTLVAHVALSLYHGFNTVGPDAEGRYRYPPKYRSGAVTYAVTSYATAVEIGSQRRRRVSTSP